MLSIYKPYGFLMSDLTYKIKLTYPYINKFSYLNRLDIVASGIVNFVINEECKNIGLYKLKNYYYEWDIIFGISTDSQDIYGLINEINPYCIVNQNKLYNLIDSYKKNYKQKFPIFSTKKVHYQNKKRRLIDLYLKDNIIIDQPKQDVSIFNIEICNSLTYRYLINKFIFDIEHINITKKNKKRILNILNQYNQLDKTITFPTIKIKANVSSNTYIRQLTTDLADELNLCAISYRIHRVLF